MSQRDYNEQRKTAESNGHTPLGPPHHFVLTGKESYLVANSLGGTLLNIDSWARTISGRGFEFPDGKSGLDLLACCLTGRTLMTGLSLDAGMRDLDSNLTEAERLKLFNTAHKLNHHHATQLDLPSYNDGGKEHENDPTMNKPSDELEDMSTMQMERNLCDMIMDQELAVAIRWSGSAKSSEVLKKFRENSEYEVVNMLPAFLELHPHLCGKLRDGPGKELVIMIRHKRTRNYQLVVRCYQGCFGHFGPAGKIQALCNIRKHNHASAQLVLLYLLTGRVSKDGAARPIEEVSPRLMGGVDTDEMKKKQIFASKGGLWYVMQSGLALVDEANLFLWLKSMQVKTSAGQIYVGTVEQFARDEWFASHKCSAIVATEQKRTELLEIRRRLAEECEKLTSDKPVLTVTVEEVVGVFIFYFANTMFCFF